MSTETDTFATKAFFDAIERGLPVNAALDAAEHTQELMDSFRDGFKAPSYIERFEDR